VLAPDFVDHDRSTSQVRKLWRQKWSHMQRRPKPQA
jgi:hypothetical protein